MDELKPCPFCGSQDVTKVIEGAKHPMIYVRCNGCLSMSGWYEADEENMMLSAWNKRAGEGQVNRNERNIRLATNKQDTESARYLPHKGY